MALAEQLKLSRENAGFSQKKIAEKLNISRQSISKWENGRGYPDIDNLILLSEIYAVSIDELLKENENLKKKILSNKIEISEKRQKLRFIKRNSHNEKDEGLLLLLLASISALLFPLGFIIIPFIILRNDKKNTLHKLVYLLCICSLLANFSSAYDYLGTYFGWGDTAIEYID